MVRPASLVKSASSVYTPKQIAEFNREQNGWTGWGNGQDSKNNFRKKKSRNKKRCKTQKNSRKRNRK